MTFDATKFVMEVEKKESEYGRIKPGNYSAKVSHVIDLGTKLKTGKDKETKEEYEYEAQQIFINFVMSAKKLVWEENKESDEKSEQTIGKVYTLSLSNNAKLHIDVKSGFGFAPENKFNPYTLIGKAVMVNVWENKGYSIVEWLSQMPEDMPEYKNELEFNGSMLKEGLHNPELEEKYLFGFAKNDLEASKEYIALTGKTPDKTLEEEDAEIEAEIAKTKSAQTESKEVTAEDAADIFDKKED